MRSLAVWIIIAACALVGRAECVLDTLVAGDVRTLQVHFRAKPRSSASTIQLRWNMSDESNYRFADLSSTGAASFDGISEQLELKTGRVVAGSRTVETSRLLADHKSTDDISRIGMSIKLFVNAVGASLQVGSAQILETLSVDYDTFSLGRIQGYAAPRDEILRADVSIDYFAPKRFADFVDVENLCEYLSASSDECEGMWRYYDRNTDPLRAALGGEYVLATVRRDSGYDIAYIAGLSSDDDVWSPLMIKGTMSSATFHNTFDLAWVTADRQLVTFGSGAVVEGDLLTLSFPYWKATLRFRRVVPSELAITND